MSGPLPRLGHCGFLEIQEEDLDTSHLHAHVLDDNARRSMIADRHPLATDSPIDAEAFFQDLGRLAPSVAKSFVPKSTALHELVFRLINDVDHTEDETSYIAMSYCWKKANHGTPRKEISPVGDLPFGWVKTVELFPIPTTPAMFQAILQERQSESEGLWFDQVCINQEDEDEKATSIGVMDLIYKNARTVVIALDDIAASEDEVMFLRQYFEYYSRSSLPINQQPNRGLSPPFMQTRAPFRSFFEKLLSSTWFERAWCTHEMRVGRSHIFLVPCESDEEDESYTFIRFTGAFFLHMLTLGSEVVSTGRQARKTALQQLFGRKALLHEREATLARSPGAQLPPLTEPLIYSSLITEVFQMKAGGNPRLPEYLRRLDANRDKTAIILNIAGFPLALRPASPLQRPSIEDECLRQLLLVGLAARDPVTLCTTGTPLQLHDGSISWLCRPTTLDIVSARQPLPRFPNPKTSISQGSDGRAEYVQLDLVFLDLPHRIQPNPNFQNHLHRARAFIDLCIQSGIESYTMWSSWQSPSHPRALSMKNVFVQVLACCFECGPNWMLDVSKRFQIGSRSLSPEIVEALCSPIFAIQNYMLSPSGRPAFSLFLDFLSTLIAYGIPWACGATERTCGPMVVSISTAGKAIIFAPFEHSKTLLIAIPDVVKCTDYDALSRGWVLTSMNPHTGSSSSPTVNWVLRSKSVVFGDSTFNGNVAMYQAPRNHRVYGP
ncbi:hypothetical protein K469DRAFT_515331, partial [Zopfia rhizophila CBS 207.26]